VNDTTVAWWFDRVGRFTGVIDLINLRNTDDPVYTEGAEQIRAIVNNMLAHARSNDVTQEMPAVDVETS
jgi:hypothetical protein